MAENVELMGVSKRRANAKVIPMPVADELMVAAFLRYHVLVRVYDGNADAWLAHLVAHGGDAADERFVRTVRVRLRREPRLLESIRRMVDRTPFWGVAQA